MKDLGKKKRRLEELFEQVLEAEIQLRLAALPKPQPERASDRELKAQHKLDMIRKGFIREDALYAYIRKDAYKEAMR